MTTVSVAPEIRQPPGLGVDSLNAGGERDRTALDYLYGRR